MIRNIYFLAPIAATIICPSVQANRIITDTKNALSSIRYEVLKEAKENKKLMKSPSFAIKLGIGVGRVFGKYDSNTLHNAMIARPFFKAKGGDSCLQDIGSTSDDIAYLQSVFSEFYSGGERSMYRLITILHRHMMQALGFSTSKTLEQFKNMMENTNKHDKPKSLTQHQFEIYCRCVARGLYAVYWFENGLS